MTSAWDLWAATGVVAVPDDGPREFCGGRVVLHAGDCFEVLKTLPDNSVDSCVTDPPYALTSIVKRFGKDGAAPAQFGRDGAFQRASSGFLGAKWDVGDVVHDPAFWAEVRRVMKPGAYVLAFAATRTYHRMACAIEDAGLITHPMCAWLFGSGMPKATRVQLEGYEEWRYGTQSLKPAMEPIYMGQKPFSEATGTANIARWGTGAVHIGACRVAGVFKSGWSDSGSKESENTSMSGKNYAREPKPDNPDGRWPANVISDGSEEVFAAFPQSKAGVQKKPFGTGGIWSGISNDPCVPQYGDGGSAARFWYVAKASKTDRAGSKHPTCKPLALMRHLVRLVTPVGGITLDPFSGSGTTGQAAYEEGMRAVLVEREAEYRDDIAERLRRCYKPAPDGDS